MFESTILIAEVEPSPSGSLEMLLRQRVPGRIRQVRYGFELLEQLEKLPEVGLVICDAELPDMELPELMMQIRSAHPGLPVLIAVADHTVSGAEHYLALGAMGMLHKSDAPQDIADLVKRALEPESAEAAHDVWEPVAAPQPEIIADPFAAIVGSAPSLQAAITQARQAARSDIAVLLKGESGVGKERFAKAIHQASPRADGPFVAVNCGAIPENLVESVLFGHSKGAFTGAVDMASGKFAEADGGTLFLDELGELKLDIQVKLLRALQEREIQPIGGKARHVDVRVISATNRDLEQAIREHKFREDLYYRLNVFPIDIPPLRQRGEGDIRALVERFTRHFAQQEHKDIRKVSDAAIGLLLSYDWPGNIRQLENAIYRAVVLAESDLLRVEDFMQISAGQQSRSQAALASALQSAQAEAVSVQEAYQISLLDELGHFKSMQAIENEVLKKALGYYRWHITRIAEALGMTRATIYKKMKQAGLEDPRHDYKG